MDIGEKVVKLVYQATNDDQSRTDKFGEVFTPEHMILRILNHFPEEVLKDPKRKWLDLTAGLGQFPSVITKVLMKTLKEYEPDEIKRYTHIIENMVYMAEYQQTSANILRECLTAIVPVRLNLYVGDSLELDPVKEWGVDNFDIVIGNPPYNDQEDADHKKGGRMHMSTSFYPNFVAKAKKIVKDGGIVSMILPARGYKPFEKEGLYLSHYIPNRVDDWMKGKMVQTRSFIASTEETTPIVTHPILAKFMNLERRNDSVNKKGIALTDFYGSAKRGWAKDQVSLNNNKITMRINLTASPINLTNFNILYALTVKLFKPYFHKTNSVHDMLDLDWLEGLDREITRKDIMNAYNLTPEDMDVIDNPEKDPYLNDFR